MKQQIGPFEVQRILKIANLYSGDLDGDAGPKTERAVHLAIRNFSAQPLPHNWESWSLQRKCILALQVLLHQNGYSLHIGALDGYAGPSTMYTFSLWAYKQEHGKNPSTWRKDDVKPEVGKPIATKIGNWGTQREVERRFGKAGGSQCTAGAVNLPFKMRIAWNTKEKISTINCHEMVARPVERIFNRIYANYSIADIQDIGLNIFGGCYSYRLKRGGKTLSIHSWGLAFDFDPIRNQLKWKSTRARLGKLDAQTFFKLWKEEGFCGLGPEKDYDWMHVQAPSL